MKKQVYLKPTKRERRNAKIVKAIWWTVGGFFSLVAILFVLIYFGIIGYMPDINELRNPADKFASTVYSSDGKEMGKFYRQNRSYVDFDQMSDYLKKALIATEDVRFEEHSGVDFRALSRSLVKRIVMGQSNAGGGSTITQQLAKQLYTPESENIFQRALQKPIEWVIAIKLERYFTKEEIMKMYFNQFDFLNNAVGIKSAAWVYFGKTPNELSLEESAMLVGMCKNPSYFNPRLYPERVKARRNVVLDQMYKAGMLTAEVCDKAKNSEIELAYHPVEDHSDGIAPYFREELRRVMMADEPVRSNYSNVNSYNADKYNWDHNPLYGWCKKNHKSDGSNYDIYSDGLRIYTTIDSRMQAHAEEAVREHMMAEQTRFIQQQGGKWDDPYTMNKSELSDQTKAALIERAIKTSDAYRHMKAGGMSEDKIMAYFNEEHPVRLFDYDQGEVTKMMTPRDSLLYMKSFLRCGMMAMDPYTGKIKAWVGGPDYKHFRYDMVSTGTRQIGSTFKPFIFSLAMQMGDTPCSTEYENNNNFGGWHPGGGTHGLGYHPQLRDALAKSSNWIPPHILEKFTPEKAVENLHNDFGITSELPCNLTLSLGSCEISILEMVSAYSAFVAGGCRTLPMMVTRITDNNGNVLAQFGSITNQAISAESSYRMLDMLMAVVKHGTATGHISQYHLGETAGKTGTTNYNADAWYMGLTPELVTGVWFGGEDRYIHFTSTGEGQGAAAALPIFGKFMRMVYDDGSLPYNQNAKFKIPDDFVMCAEKIYDNEGGRIVERTRDYVPKSQRSGDSESHHEESNHPATDQEAVEDILN